MIWAKSFGKTWEAQIGAIDYDSTFGFLVSGTFEDSCDLDPTSAVKMVYGNSINDVFVAQMDTAGNLVWGKAFGRASYDYVQSVEIGKSGHIYIGGYFRGTSDFDPGKSDLLYGG